MKKLLLVAVLALTTVLVLPSVASAKTPTLKSLAKTVAALQKKVNAQATTIASLTTRLTAAEGKIATLDPTQGATIAALSTKLTADEATIAALQNSNVMALNPYLSVTAVGPSGAVNGVIGPNIVFKGANLQIKSPTSESDTSGTGNLIVGWDDNPYSPPSGYRSGSNNLVCGDNQTFTSWGGFVAGLDNKAFAPGASVSGGDANTASGGYASVSGGQSLTESHFWGWATSGYEHH